jgi:DNA modification methylase
MHLPRPCVVFDPFNGSGRTGIAADRLGRDYIGTELNAKYVHVAIEQLERDREKRKHNGKPRRKPVPQDIQPSLFTGAA